MENNHDYKEPQPGTTDWHVPINENFEQIDRDVEIRDAEENLNEYRPKEGAKFFATDSERQFLGDGDNWRRVASSGQDPTLSSIQAKSVNGEVYASEFDGAGLASKIKNALNWLKQSTNGQGRVCVTPKDDGSPWEWDREIIVDPTDQGGIELDINSNVRIRYSGDGVALTLDSTWSEQNNNFHINSAIRGGEWISTGESPEGCIRIEDSYRTQIERVKIRNFIEDSPLQGNRETFGVQLRNYEGWTESTLIRDCRFENTSIAIDLEPSNYNGGNGSSSFHGTVIDNNRIEVRNIGLRARGGFDYATVQNNSFFSKGTEDDAWHIQLGGSDINAEPFIEGTTIISNKHEDPGGAGANDAEDVAYRLAPSYFGFKGPGLINNKIFLSDTHGGRGAGVRDDSGGSKPAKLLQMETVNGRIRFRDLTQDTSVSFNFDNGFGTWEVSSSRFDAEAAGSESDPAVKMGGNGGGLYTDGEDLYFVNENNGTERLTDF